ncbi:hypothetical protein ACJJTC_016675 [Scirpophaga incertulas]
MESSESVFCLGCLNGDRKIKLIDNYTKRDCFLEIINENLVKKFIMNTIWLCWECDAYLTRFLMFKQQVNKCCIKLEEFMNRNINISHYDLPSRLNLEPPIAFYIGPLTTQCDDNNIIKCEYVEIEIKKDVESTHSDNFDDDTVLIEFKSKKRKNKLVIREKKEHKKKKNKKGDEIVKEIELTEEELLEERKLFSEREDYINAMFHCEKCLVTFPNVDDLNDHINIKHDANKSKFTCTICECTFATEVSYNYHMNKHMRRYQCMVCMEKFLSKRAVIKHYDLTHCHIPDFDYEANGLNESYKSQELKEVERNDSDKQDEASFPCESCDKTFRWKTSLRKHLETHRIEMGQKRKPYCEPCRLSFTTTSNLQKHVKTSSKHQIQLKLWKMKESPPEAIEQIKRAVISSKQQFRCPQCGKDFQWRGNLDRHMRSHTARANGELVCEPCNRTFSSIATFQQHMKGSKKHVSEEDFKYICSDCGKRFANRTRLKDHVDWEHLKNYVHICNVCQKIFKSHTSLYLHKQVVHKKDSAEHLCDHCGKHFPNQAKLRSHIVALHSGEAPYRCARCPARFSWHSCLSRHARRVHRPPPPARD